MLYLVVTKSGKIRGRFKSKDKAVDYLMDCWFDGINSVKLKTVTEEEYEAMAKKEIKNEV